MTNNNVDFVENDYGSCFICGYLLKESGVKITDVYTTFLSIPFPDKIGYIVGNKFVVVVSELDKICNDCYVLVNHLDELEHNLKVTKRQIVELLEKKYDLRSASGYKLDKVPPERQSFSVKNSGPICHELDDSLNNTIKNSFEELVYFNSRITNYNNSEDDSINNYTSEKGVLNITKSTFGKSDDSSHSYFEDVLDESSQICDDSCSVSTDIRNGSCNTSVREELKTDRLYEKVVAEIGINKTLESNTDYHEGIDLKTLSKTEVISENISSFELNCVSRDCFVDISGKVNGDVKKESGPEPFSDPTSIDGKHFVCTICDVPFPKLSLFTRHMKSHQVNSEKIKCPFCDVKCHDHLHYLCHRKNVHDVLKCFTCGVCDEEFSSNKDLKNHLLVSHGGNKQYVCSECGQEFKRHDRFQNHKLYFHGNQECRFCGKHIPNVVKLRQHEKRHARGDSNQYICEVCGRAFKTPGGLRVHKVSHTGNYKFFCEFCGRGFMSSVILEEHKGVHTKEERYICDICGRKFVLYSTFHLHIQWHKDPFPFPCSMCDKKFKYRSVRSIHVRRDHTGEHPYKCVYCDAKYLKASYLKRHLILHTKEYPFVCDICKKGFGQRRNLARHLSRIHNDKSLLNSSPKKCQYKVVLRPEEFLLST